MRFERWKSVFSVTLCSVLASVATAQEKPYSSFRLQLDGDVATLTFFDQNQQELHRIIIDKSTWMFRLFTSDGREAWVQVDSGTEEGDAVRTSTSSSGKSLRLKVHYPRGRTQGRPNPASVSIWESGRWVAVPLNDAEKLRRAELELCDTPELLLLLQSLRSALAGGAKEGTIVPLSRYLAPDGVACVVPTQSSCLVLCLLVTVFPPIHWCVDGVWPDNCECPAARGFWDLSCCCGWDTLCFLECSRWYAMVLPPQDDNYTGGYEAGRHPDRARAGLRAVADVVRRPASLVSPPPDGS